MGNENRGKQFEGFIREAFEKVPNTHVIRLIDPQNGFAGVRNICDFVVYRYPYQFLVECKSCHGNTFPFGNITENQWELANIRVPGIIAGYMIWFIDKDRTIFVPAEDMKRFKDNGDKSFSLAKHEDSDYIEIIGKKKRVFFEYDLEPFLNLF